MKLIEWAVFIALAFVAVRSSYRMILIARCHGLPRGIIRTNRASIALQFIWLGLLVVFFLNPNLNKLHLLWLFPSGLILTQVGLYVFLKFADNATVDSICESFVVDAEINFQKSGDLENAIKESMRNTLRKHSSLVTHDTLSRLDRIADQAYDPISKRFRLNFILYNLNMVSYWQEYGQTGPGMHEDTLSLTVLDGIRGYVRSAQEKHSILKRFSLIDLTEMG